MKKLITYSLPLIALVLCGCVARITPYEVDRVDQELKGNRGMVRGGVPDIPETKKKRVMYNLEIELPSKMDRELKGRDTDLYGNRGYLVGKGVSEEKSAPAKKEKGVMRLVPFTRSAEPQVVYQPTASPDKEYTEEKGSGTIGEKRVEEKIYVVKKGDTLQKISNKMYGTTKKWKKIFEANKDTLKDPDDIRPDQKLVIPVL